MTATSDIKVGVIGLGSIGTTHAKALRSVPGAHVIAFSGGSPETMAECGWPDAARLSPTDVIAHPDVDVVAICTPSDSHAALALQAAQAGRHALVEKPIALSTQDADALVQAQDTHGVVIAMVAQRRFEPEAAAIKALLDDGSLGRVRVASTQVHWTRDDAYYAAAPWRAAHPGGGSLMNQGVHNVDLLQWLCGPADEVTAQSATLAHDMEAEDTTVSTVRFASGALGTISTTTGAPPGTPATLTLHTSLGTVELGQGEITRWDVPGVTRPEFGDGVTSGASDPAAIGLVGHVSMWQEVFSAIRDRRPCTVDAHEAAHTVRLLCGIYDAAESGRRVTVGAGS
ncbi:Gfo/Idh/MocA family protein [Microbacterium sp. JB110]|uniref:Gfo/Idh/MocA family protein n=1 Tax=Microbacterium sp. JB110 TaxID=2024477 RepID=UPI00097F34D4|nr:Gfo/Idh/MocA family oxidoreductase [Microbacterium sp. JB110]SJM45497.1 dehydrogenase-like protein [Frigoribacterium sp. JB110]